MTKKLKRRAAIVKPLPRVSDGNAGVEHALVAAGALVPSPGPTPAWGARPQWGWGRLPLAGCLALRSSGSSLTLEAVDWCLVATPGVFYFGEGAEFFRSERGDIEPDLLDYHDIFSRVGVQGTWWFHVLEVMDEWERNPL